MNLKKLFAACTFATLSLSAVAEDTALAFPGAEGYGRWATGGRGGKVYVVTSLNDCSENDLVEGTFRWAVKQPGKKIVTFAVCGTIYLTSALDLNCGDLTILGQTAPGDGVCLADYPVTISCENAIIRYMRFRLGQRQVANHEGDGFGFNSANNVIMDHCSVSWSIDECLSISAATNLTIQWCMIEQALNDAGHSKGAHGYGGNWGGTNVSFHHNLITQCTSRVPRLGGDTSPLTNDFCDLRNNVFYNWGGNGCYGAEAIDVNFVNNYYKPGPCTDQRSENIRKRICAIGIRTSSYIKSYPAFAHDLHKWGHFYTEGNFNPDYEDVTNNNWVVGIVNQVDGSSQDGTWTAVTRDTIHLREPREFVSVTTHSAEDAYEKVLDYAGASFYRDCVDELMVRQVRRRLGDTNSGSNGAMYGQIDKQTDNGLDATEVENGAWPRLLTQDVGYYDDDHDGIADNYEENWGLDETNGSDGATLYVGTREDYKGYSYTEIYQNLSRRKLRAWNDSCLAGGTKEGVDEPTILCLRRLPWEHEISALTFKGYDKTIGRQLFADGVRMTGGASIVGGTGDEQTFKLKGGQQIRIFIPENIKAKAIRVYGFARNHNDFYISELDGKSYGSTQYVIPGADGAMGSVTVPFTETVSNKEITITMTGEATPTVKFYIIEDEPTAIRNAADKDTHTDQAVYDLNGRRVENPTAGLYIINGKKAILR